MLDHKTYNAIANELLSDPRVTEGNLFGVPVLKIGGTPFDPSGRNHPMKEWIRIKEPAAQAKKKWLTLAVEARAFVEQKQR